MLLIGVCIGSLFPELLNTWNYLLEALRELISAKGNVYIAQKNAIIAKYNEANEKEEKRPLIGFEVATESDYEYDDEEEENEPYNKRKNKIPAR